MHEKGQNALLRGCPAAAIMQQGERPIIVSRICKPSILLVGVVCCKTFLKEEAIGFVQCRQAGDAHDANERCSNHCVRR